MSHEIIQIVVIWVMTRLCFEQETSRTRSAACWEIISSSRPSDCSWDGSWLMATRRGLWWLELLSATLRCLRQHTESLCKRGLLRFSFTKPGRGLGGNTCSARSHTLQQLINTQLRLKCLIVTQADIILHPVPAGNDAAFKISLSLSVCQPPVCLCLCATWRYF